MQAAVPGDTGMHSPVGSTLTVSKIASTDAQNLYSGTMPTFSVSTTTAQVASAMSGMVPSGIGTYTITKGTTAESAVPAVGTWKLMGSVFWGPDPDTLLQSYVFLYLRTA
jgi:hypothetical protein